MKKLFTILFLFPLFLNAQITTYDIFEGDLVGLDNDACGDGSIMTTPGCLDGITLADWGFTWTSTGEAQPLSVTMEISAGAFCDELDSDLELNGVYQDFIEGLADDCFCGLAPTIQTITIDVTDYVFDGVNTVNVLEQNICTGLRRNPDWGGAFARVTVEYPCTPTEIIPDAANIDIIDVYCGGTYEVTDVPTATNDCNYTFDGTTTDPTSFTAAGTYTINWAFDDGEGNTTSQVQEVELTSGIVVDEADIDISDTYCGGTFEVTDVPTATNDCGETFDGTTTDPTSFTATGTYTINWNFEDNDGNTTSQIQEVELTEDTEAPIPVVADLPDLESDCSVEVTETPQATDNCEAEVVIYDIMQADLFGLTTDCGNGSVYDANDFGFIWNSGAPFDAVASITLELNPGVNCGGSPSFPLALNGTYQEDINEWAFCDCALTNAFSVSIELDPADYVVNGNNEVLISNPDGVFMGLSPNADWGGAYARVHVTYGQSITATTTDPLTYNEIGTHTVTWMYEDWNGNTTTQEQTVIVNDDDAPVISDCPADISIATNNNNCTAIVTWDEPTAVDICDDSPSIISSHSPNDVFPSGITMVTYTFEDVSGNSSTCEFEVEVTNDVDLITSSTPTSCNGSSDGSAEAEGLGGAPDYTYSWTDGETTLSTNAELTNVPAGDYDVTVTDQNNCTASETVTVTEPDAIDVTITSTVNPSDCGISDGEATINVTGGTIATDYTYAWSNTDGYTSTLQDPTDLPSGVIKIVVTDDNGCTGENQISLSDPNGPTLVLNAGGSVTDLDCFGDENGAITLDVTLNGGATAADFDWNEGEYTTEDIENLTAGNYTVVATDDNDCVASESYTITQPDEIVISGEVEDVTCNGDSDGSVTITVEGGTVATDYVYDWTDDGGFASADQDLVDVSAATYTLFVTDDNACQVNTTFTVSEPNALSATATVTDEEIGNDGEITLSVTGGVGAKSYSWSGPDGYSSSLQNIFGLSEGTYEVTITDDCGTFTLTVEVNSVVGLTSPERIDFKVYPNPSSAIFNVEGPTTSENFTYHVIDISGKVILTKESDNEKTILDLSNCEKGVYLLRVENKETSSTMKLIVN